MSEPRYLIVGPCGRAEAETHAGAMLAKWTLEREYARQGAKQTIYDRRPKEQS